jgi:hypothetical protein
MKTHLLAASLLVLAPAVAACGDGDGGSSAEEWCTLARDLESSDDIFGDDETPTPEALKASFTELLDVLERAEKAAPDEIKDDVEASLGAFRQFSDVLADADYNFLDVDLASIEAISVEAEAAGDRITEYNERECGIVSEDTTTGDTSSGGETDASLPQGSVRDVIMQQFEDMGMTQEQAACVADNIDEAAFSGGDIDPTEVLSVYTDCGVDPATLGGGG